MVPGSFSGREKKNTSRVICRGVWVERLSTFVEEVKISYAIITPE